VVLLAYFFITVVSIFFAINYKEGYFDVFKTFLFITLIAAFAIVFSNTKNWHLHLPKFVVVAAFIAFAVGIAQYFTDVFNSPDILLPDGREIIYSVRGFMSHKNQYAISLMLMLPFLGYGIYQYKKGWKWASIIAFVLLMVMIVLLKTRSVWVGIALSLLAIVFITSISPKKFGISSSLRNIIVSATIVVIVAGATVINIAGKKDPYSFFGKLRSITNPLAGNNVYRLKIWHLTTIMIADYPLTGVGAGNWKLHSADYYRTNNYNFKKVEMNWLRPHNDFLWVFAEKGIIGFLLFLSIFGFAIVYILKLLFSDRPPEQKALLLFILSGLICYLTVSFFSFPLERINQQAYLAMLLAAVLTLHHSARENTKPITNRKIILYPALLVLLLSVVYSYAMLDMEYKVRKTRNAMGSSNWRVMLSEAQSISTVFRTLDPEATPISSYAAQAYSKLGQTEKSRDAYIEALKAHPTKINMMNNLGKVYYELGEYEKAEELFLKALFTLPDYQESLINLSTTYYKMGEYEKTLETLNRIPTDKRDETSKRNIIAVKQLLKDRENDSE
jgi:O-antigen ligase